MAIFSPGIAVESSLPATVRSVEKKTYPVFLPIIVYQSGSRKNVLYHEPPVQPTTTVVPVESLIVILTSPTAASTPDVSMA